MSTERGLKDHEIRELINRVTKELREFPQSPLANLQSLREIVSEPIIDYLEENNLRRDKR